MSKVVEYRRENIRALVDQRGGLTRLSKAMGYKNPSFLSQQVGPNPSREVTEATARKVEEVLGLETGVLDRAPGQAKPSAQSDVQTSLIGEVIKMVGRAYETEGVPLAPARFADLVALTLADSMARGHRPSEDHVRAVVRLLK
jgi:hypothetical protein